MKYSTLESFIDSLGQASDSPLYFIVGGEPYDRSAAMKALLSCAAEKKMGKTLFYGDRVSSDLFSALESVPMFAPRDLILIQDVDAVKKPILQRLEEYFSCPNPKVQLVLEMQSVNRATKFFKEAEKAGVVLDLPELKPWEKEKLILGKIRKMVESQGKRIQPAASEALLLALGVDQALLHQEIEKLICYIGEAKEICLKDIEAVTSSVNRSNIWQLSDAIFEKKSSHALQILHGLIEDGESIFGLLRQIRSQFQNKLQIASILESGGTALDVQQKFPYMRGRILDTNISQTKNYGGAKLKKGISLLHESELRAKNSSFDHILLLDQLLIKLIL